MAQYVTQRAQFSHLALQLVGLKAQLVARNIGPAVSAEHAGDLFQREAGRLAHGDQRQLQQHVGIELPPQAPPPERGDQADLLVLAQGRGRDARAFGDLADIENSHA